MEEPRLISGAGVFSVVTRCKGYPFQRVVALKQLPVAIGRAATRPADRSGSMNNDTTKSIKKPIAKPCEYGAHTHFHLSRPLPYNLAQIRWMLAVQPLDKG